MMKLPSILKTPKHRSFEFKPRYYNAEKEAFDERIRIAMTQAGHVDQEAEAVKARIRAKYQDRRKIKKGGSSMQQNLRILLIIALLSATFLWILK